MLRYYPLLPGALPWWLRYLLYTTTPFRNGGPSCAALASLRGQSCHTSHQASRLDFSDVKERTALQDFHFNYFLSWMNVTKPITLIAHLLIISQVKSHSWFMNIELSFLVDYYTVPKFSSNRIGIVVILDVLIWRIFWTLLNFDKIFHQCRKINSHSCVKQCFIELWNALGTWYIRSM